MSFYGEADLSFPNLGIYIENLPAGIEVFGFRIAFYGFFVIAALLTGWFILEKQIKNRKKNIEFFMNLMFFSLPAVIIGAKLFYVVFALEDVMEEPRRLLEFSTDRLVMYGGFVFFVFAVIIFCRIQKQNPFETMDIIIPGMLVVQIISKCGHFFSKQDIGIYTDNPFAMRVGALSGQYGNIVLEDSIYIQGHPTFLYEIFWNIILLVLLMNVKKIKKHEGTLLLLYIIGDGIGNVLIEPVRLDNLYAGFTGMPVSVLMAIITAGVSLMYVILKYYQINKKEKNI